MTDSQWLAVLARFGLVRSSFIPPHDLHKPRRLSRYRRKLTAMHTSEINRRHKILDDAGTKLGGGADINGLSAREMVTGLIADRPLTALLDVHAVYSNSSARISRPHSMAIWRRGHRFILEHTHEHTRIVEHSLAELDAYMLAAMPPLTNWRIAYCKQYLASTRLRAL